MVPHAALLSAALLAAAAAAAPSWSKVATVGAPYAPRGEASLSLCGAGSVCLLGGRGSSPVGVFDTAARAWTAGKNPPFEINHFQAFRGPDGCAWVVGAWTGPFPAEKTVDSILKYCPADDTWTTGEKIARPRGAGGALYYKGAVYLVSGNVGGHNSNAKLVDWFDKFDPDTGKWTTLPPVPHRMLLSPTVHPYCHLSAHDSQRRLLPSSTPTASIDADRCLYCSFAAFAAFFSFMVPQPVTTAAPSFSMTSSTLWLAATPPVKSRPSSLMLSKRWTCSTLPLRNGLLWLKNFRDQGLASPPQLSRVKSSSWAVRATAATAVPGMKLTS